MKRSPQITLLAGILSALACSSGQASTSETKSNVAASNVAARAVPLAGRVTDAAHILSAEQQAGLGAKLERLEHTTKHQLVIVTVPTLGGRDVAEFTKDLANAWGIGRKGYNDGVVILVAPNERKVRIAVGYGLEGRLTNDMCRQIIVDKILPRFRRGDVSGGIEAGTDAVIHRLN